VKNEGIRRFVDAQENIPYAHVYRLHKFDNPIYADRKEEILASMAGLPEKYVRAVMYGDWMDDDNTVYQFNGDTMIADKLPPNYSPSWRHVEAVDPALKSKFGFILLAEDPATYIWYVIKAEYIQGIYVPTEMVTHVEKLVSGYNLVRRVSDPHEVWYIQTANHMKVHPAYTGVYDKQNRKSLLMKNLQEALGNRLLICSWCTDLIDEFTTMRWSEDSQTDKIINSSSYHLLDALQYGIDVLPARDQVFTPMAPDAQLRMLHEQKLIQKAKEAEVPQRKHWKQFKIVKKQKWG
jgi:hypothetical protein